MAKSVLYCACAETALSELPFKILTSIRFSNPDFLKKGNNLAIRRRFQVLFHIHHSDAKIVIFLSVDGASGLWPVLHWEPRSDKAELRKAGCGGNVMVAAFRPARRASVQPQARAEFNLWKIQPQVLPVH